MNLNDFIFASLILAGRHFPPTYPWWLRILFSPFFTVYKYIYPRDNMRVWAIIINHYRATLKAHLDKMERAKQITEMFANITDEQNMKDLHNWMD